jgi:hypothetical protein
MTMPVVVGGTDRDLVGVSDQVGVSLVDLLDRVLARGVVLTGEVTLSVADVDLVHISLRALVSSVRPDLFDADAAAGAEPG